MNALKYRLLLRKGKFGILFIGNWKCGLMKVSGDARNLHAPMVSTHRVKFTSLLLRWKPFFPSFHLKITSKWKPRVNCICGFWVHVVHDLLSLPQLYTRLVSVHFRFMGYFKLVRIKWWNIFCIKSLDGPVALSALIIYIFYCLKR